jgi:NAD(P)-dependent dehydrogenase (short-subunit alcohol dehydrogenase family)
MTGNDIFSISGQRVLIIGGTAGIGLAVAQHFVQAGARVVITGRRPEGESIASGIGGRFVRMDLTVDQSITTGTRQAAELLDGGIDTLILNAGTGTPAGTADQLDMGAFRQVFEVNLFGITQAMRDGLAFMQSGGSVIVTSSPASTVFIPGVSAYSASKAAINAVVKTTAIELGLSGIRVNAVLPGVIETEMAFDPDAVEEELAMLSTLTATGKIRQPSELAPPFQFLASAASATCTGTLLACEDGFTAGISQSLLAKAFDERE